jgi:hypothetical protein
MQRGGNNNITLTIGLNQGRNKKVDYQKPKSGGRSDPDDQTEREVGKTRENKHPAQLRVEKREAIKSEPVISIVFGEHAPTRPPLGWDGQQAYELVDNFAIGLTDGSKRPWIRAGVTVANVLKCAAGYVVHGPEGMESAVATSCCGYEGVSVEFTLDGQIYLPQNYFIFRPFLDHLRKKVSTCFITEAHRNAALAQQHRHFPGFPDLGIITDTWNYYVHYNRYKLWALQTGFGKVVVDERDRLVDMELVKYGQMKFDAGDIARYTSIDCDLPDTYSFRRDCYLVFKEGNNTKVWYRGLRDENLAQLYPHFTDSEPDAMGNRYTRSVYVGFCATATTPFITYSINAINACKALKRMCGGRDNDDELTSIQYAMFGELFFDKSVPWVANTEAVHIFRDWNWRTRFLKAARLSYAESECEYRPFAGVSVGSEAIINHIIACGERNDPEIGHMIERSWYGNPFGRKRGWFMDEDVYYGQNMFLRLVREVGAKNFKIVDQMKEGFTILLNSFNATTLDNYAQDHPKWLYLNHYNSFKSFLDYEACRRELAIIPHIKKALRHMFVERQDVHNPDDNMTRFVEAKVKKEFAKYKKVPRLYVTYDAGCMYANHLPEWAKVCLDGAREFTNNGVTFVVHIFAKPTCVGLEEAFVSLIDAMDSRDKVYILIYSDDSVWCGNVNGNQFAFNVDISSCDSGNKGGVFGLIYMLLAQFSPELAMGLIKQCGNVINLKNPENPDHVCEIYMNSLFEGSGTVLTTVLNHVAMYMISMAAVSIIGDCRDRIGSWEKVSSLVELSGAMFGHVLTVEPAKDELGFAPELIQFLKRSPLRLTTGEYVPVLNYGTIFRGFGSLEGDLTADMVGLSVPSFAQLSVADRGDLFLSGVVAGLKNEPNSIILSALRTRFSKLPGNGASEWSKVKNDRFRLQSSNVLEGSVCFDSRGGVATESLCRRYALTDAQLTRFAGIILNCTIGSLYPDDCVDSFARVDYGCAPLEGV